jgi:hypothetical protein
MRVSDVSRSAMSLCASAAVLGGCTSAGASWVHSTSSRIFAFGMKRDVMRFW